MSAVCVYSKLTFSTKMSAVCILNDGFVKGTLIFNQAVANEPVNVTGEIVGLCQGLHSLHIQEFGLYAVGYWELGNIEADPNGVVKINISDNMISLEGDYSIIGGTVVHCDPDEVGSHYLRSRATGRVGTKLACGVIEQIKT